MQKKIFMQKNSQKGGGGGSSYLKYLLIAAVGLLFLVIVTPYLLKGKGKDVPRRAVPDKGVLKELPKPPEQIPREAVPELAKSADPAKPPEPAKPTEPGKPPEAMKPVEPVPAVPQRTLPETPPTAQVPAPAPEQAPPQIAKPAEPAPKDLFPKKGTPAAKTPGKKTDLPGQQPEKPAMAGKPGSVSPVKTTTDLKGKTVSGKQLYAVQVGCFKEKSDAEIVQKNLAKKGYAVILCPSQPSGGKYAYTVMTKPVASMSKAATLAEQMKGEGKTSPTVIKAPGAACDLPGSKPGTPAQKPKPKAGAPQQN
ncbi:MAG: SPOR domain-containing protein [Syntrophobacteraceae bacterium]